jgi:NAD(P)-dependent dehydrogenase (short-subunit alcohol dehydrogenase family)
MKIFAGKTALITGASRGIGRAIAAAFAENGARVIVHYVSNQSKAEETIQAIESAGGEAFAISGDLRYVAEIKSLYDTLDRDLSGRSGTNRIDFLINNAGVAPFIPTVVETTEEEFDDAFDLNVKGTFFMCQQAIPRLNDNGRIINFSSVVARGNLGQSPAYKAAKRAVVAISESLAGELGPRGIAVNTIAPGATRTEMLARADEKLLGLLKQATAMQRVGEPKEIADFIVMLCRPESAWVTGQLIEVSGGLNL